MTGPSQQDRVVALLRQRGDQGFTSTEFHIPVVDGRKPIPRVAARINDLRERGFVILTSREPNGTARYSLFYDPEAQVRAA